MTEIQYSEDRKYAVFNGIKYTRDEETGYYLNSTTRKRLHRAVYEFHYGEIPDGFDIHHIDQNKNNNEAENLRLLSKEDHKKIHADLLTEEQRKFRRNNMIARVIPAATQWHKSEPGKLWHKEHYQAMKERLEKKKMIICACCQKSFLGDEKSIFCSNKCKSSHRRKSGVDDVRRICSICGAEFVANKYSSTTTCSNSCASKLRWNKKNNKAS